MNPIKLDKLIKSLRNDHELKLYYEIGGKLEYIKLVNPEFNNNREYALKYSIKDGWIEVFYTRGDSIEVKAVDIDLIKAYDIYSRYS